MNMGDYMKNRKLRKLEDVFRMLPDNSETMVIRLIIGIAPSKVEDIESNSAFNLAKKKREKEMSYNAIYREMKKKTDISSIDTLKRLFTRNSKESKYFEPLADVLDTDVVAIKYGIEKTEQKEMDMKYVSYIPQNSEELFDLSWQEMFLRLKEKQQDAIINLAQDLLEYIKI